MWLPNNTTLTYRNGLADYFSLTITISRVSAGVANMFAGDSLFSDPTLENSGTGLSIEQPVELDAGISLQNQTDSKSAKLSAIKMLNMRICRAWAKVGKIR